ncbi:hypothetical protein [Pseudidiomarina terrestris]|uniref:hypothetical protein n=1 Tax=Pseudidiomarina terrestris TaxID=2820060 RepID=UPI0026552F51|nr:hypothetical protein [Pseudidiomarina sp. 1ASP75-5]MDN7135963.1 hypothetical protein [Pseudidiomarina sp. 1ASP75-5]
MIRSGICAFALMLWAGLVPASAQPVDRVLWYEAETTSTSRAEATFKAPASDWWRLRVYADNAADQQAKPEIWSSTGGGIFVSHSPLDAHHDKDYTDYFYAVNTTEERSILLQHSDARTTRLYHSKRTSAAVLHDDARIKLSDQHSVTTLTMQTGFEAHDMQLVPGEEDYVTEFSEPGLYHLEIRIPWRASYELYETLTLQTPERQLQLAANLDDSTRYEDDRGYVQLLSRPIRVPFYVTEAGQQLSLDLDRDAYLRWLQSDASAQFLAERNAPDAIEQAQDKQLALQQQPWLTTSFFRSLPPQQALATESFIPLTGAVRKPEALVLPSSAHPTREPEYFYQLPAGHSASFALPEQTRNAPVKLTVKWQEDATAFMVRTNSGEQQEVRLRPELTPLQHWQLDNGSQLALISKTDTPAHKVTEILLDFNQPYQSLTVTSAGDHDAWLRLDYANEQPASVSESGWLNLSPSASAELVSALREGGSSALTNSALKQAVATEWHTRLQSRSAQFTERYASPYLDKQRSITADQFASVRNALATTFDVQLKDVADVYQQLTKLGYNFTARQLLVDLAAGSESALQTQAETLLLQLFAEQERWFDTEGYWAWRLFHHADPEALAAIAYSWTQQNRQREAALLFLLIDKSQSTEIPTELALRAAVVSQQSDLAEYWFGKLTAVQQQSWPADVTDYHWVRQRPEFAGKTREALIYNGDLDLYLTTFYLDNATSLRLRLAGSPRLKVTLYPELTEATASGELHKVTLTINDNSYPLAVRMDRASESLSWSQSEQLWVGLPQSYTFTLNADQVNDISIEAQGFAAGVVIEAAEPQLLTASAAAAANASLPAVTPPLTQRLSELALATQHSELADAERKQVKANTLGTALTDTQQLLLDRLTQGYAWQRLDTVSSSDGIAYLETERWQPSAPWWQVRRALMTSDVRPGERRLADDEQAQLALDLRAPKAVTLEVRKATELSGPAAPATLSITTSDGTMVRALSSELLSIPLNLSSGEHTLSLEFTEPSSALVLYRLLDSDGESLLPGTQVKTYRASQDREIELFIPANNLLRIDHYTHRDALASHSYQWFAEDTHYQVAHSDGSGEHSYYRFFIWQQQPLADEPQTPLLSAAQPEPSVAQQPPTIWPVDPQRAVFAGTLYQLGEQDDGTWGFALGYRARNNFDEDLRTGREEFIDSRWNYQRQLNDWDAYWNSSLQWRAHNDTDLHTLVSDNDLYWLPNKYFDAQARLNLYYQAAATDDEAEGAWSAYASLSGRWKYYWNNRTRNELELLVFGRELSEELTPAVPIDDDIVTQYKLDHRYGLTVRDQLTYQPWLDTRVHLEGQFTLNELGQGQLLDHWSVTSGWRQYFKPWRLGLDASYTQYLRDDNRRRRLSSTQLALSVDYEWWQAQGNLWQLSFDIRHDINRNTTGAFLGISWNHTAGQGYDDFAPPTLLFSPLRQRHALEYIETNDITINDPLEAVDEN